MNSQARNDHAPIQDRATDSTEWTGIATVLRGIELVSEWVGKVASFLILGLALVVGYDVCMRFFLNQPTIWGQEFSAMLFGTFIILGGAFA